MLKSKRLAHLGAFFLLLLSAWVPSHYAHLTGDKFSMHSTLLGPIELPEPKAEWLADFEKHINEGESHSAFPGLAVAIVKDNQVLMCQGFGYKDQKSNEKVDRHTVFRLASMSKGVAAALAGNMVYQNAIHWDDKVVKYIPEFRMQDHDHSKQVSIRHILSHSAGFPYHSFTNLVEANVPLNDIISAMGEIQPIAEVGKIYSYQNAGFSMISEVLERSAGDAFEDLMQERLFDPLNMLDASVTYAALIRGDNVASPHMRSKSGWRKTSQQDIYYQAIPAGGINASISDMAQYLQALLGYYPDILPPHILDDLYTPVVDCPVKWKYFRGWEEINDLDYGLGFRIADFDGHKIIYHGGYIDGFRSEIALDPKEKIGICLLTNSSSSFPKKSLRKFLQAYYEVNMRS